MTTIPASQLVRVNPNVLSAGGNALALNGLMIDNNTRIPVDTILSFPNDGTSVSDYFGASAPEVEIATVYFNGFNTSTQKPTEILFCQYPATSVAAWLRGGNVTGITIPQLKLLSGSMTVVVDGYTYTAASIDLAAATSYSSAAGIIQTGLNTSLPSGASVTGAIAPGTASVTGSISGNRLYVTVVGSGTLVTGALLSGTGVTAGTRITGQIDGTTGGAGTYAVSVYQAAASTTITATYGTLTVSDVASGTLSVGQTVSGSGVTAGTRITALGTGTGGTGTYIVQTTQTASSTSITTTGTALAVTFDSVSGGFVITSGTTGAASTIEYATGTLSPLVFLTESTASAISQGSDPQTPSEFMTGITQISQNWATFMTTWDPDDGQTPTQKLAFATWNNGQNKRYAYVVRDSDTAPTLSNNAAASLGRLIEAADIGGTCLVWDSLDQHLDAFVCGTTASIDFQQTNGRITFAFRGQEGLTATVTNATVASNLAANGYNFYGAYATANQQFLLFQRGTVSGAFQWMDSYVDQIWLNNALQQALMVLLQEVNSIPYNNPGYALIKAACADPISAALNFGAIRAGVTLSALQAAQVNAAAGIKVSDTIQIQGWYLQVKDAQPQVRQARQSPPINFWYTDGQSVQLIELNSVLIQ